MNEERNSGLAVVTGASSGIGLELAKLFAENGYDLIVCAEDDAIEAVAQELRQSDTDIESVQADLAEEAGVDRLYQRMKNRDVQAVALNAGAGAGGAFADGTALEDELKLVDLNVRSTVQLAKHAVSDMTQRGEGRILFTSSIASTQPGTYQAVYNASKSFVQSFALALREELKDSGVTVTSLMPGPVETEFFERADMQDTRVGAGDKDDAADVARQGFEALMNGDERVVASSLTSKAMGIGSRVIPDSVKAKVHGRMAEPGSADEG